jgi:hypothetical protein
MPKNISPAILVTSLLCALALLAPLAAISSRQDAGGAILGRVIERDSGQSLAAEIGLVIRDKGGITMRHINASEQGQFEITGLPSGEIHLATKLAGYAVEHDSFSLSEGETRQVEFRLIRSGVVRGIILDSGGGAVADARIRLIYADETSARRAIAATYQWEMGEVRSDAAGSFVAEVHPEKEFIVEASHPGFIGEVSEPMRLVPTEDRESVKLSLSRGSSFEGEVRDENGNPVPGAQVRLMDTEERPELQRFVSPELLKLRARTAVSGADGKFRFDLVNPARKALVIAHPKYQSVRQTVEMFSDREHTPVVTTLKSRYER